MNELSIFSAFLVGLAGGVHCVGMCGGIVGAFSYALPKGSAILPYSFAYNSGRVFSYMLAGCITGGLGYVFSQQVEKGLVLLQFLSAVLLFLLGLYIAGWWQAITKIEKLGAYFWKRIHPWSKSLLPFKHPLQAFPYGMIWGWLPCGLVYSVLTWSLASGSILQGALIMLGFGLGTLPIMLLMALGFNSVQQFLQKPATQRLMGMGLMVFAGYQLFSAISGAIH
ncbi:sulfite exporter TauE/SafE family protein [Paraglaciecola aestuariivivens]